MARYLITGVAGFIGSSLADGAARAGEYVRGLDNFSTGRRENIHAWIREKIDFREADILERERAAGRRLPGHRLRPARSRFVVGAQECCRSGESNNRANVEGTVNVLMAAREAKVKRVVYAASSSVYGETPTLPKREDMAVDPISPYGVAARGNCT